MANNKDRYSRAKIRYNYFKRKNSNLKEVKSLSTTIYEKVPLRNDDIYLIAQYGDRLDNLAAEYYGDSKLWWFIARVNNLKSINIEAGTSLRIPVSTDRADTF